MRGVALALAAVAVPFVFSSSAAAMHDLLEFRSAVAALEAVDPTIDPPPNDGKHDFVVGGFEDSGGFRNGLSAHSSPSGDDPFGHTSATNTEIGQKLRQRVVCLDVSGRFAAIGVRGSQWYTPGSQKSPSQELLLVRDGGPGGFGDGFVATGMDPEGCKGLALAAMEAPLIVSGNVLVHDAQP